MLIDVDGYQVPDPTKDIIPSDLHDTGAVAQVLTLINSKVVSQDFMWEFNTRTSCAVCVRQFSGPVLDIVVDLYVKAGWFARHRDAYYGAPTHIFELSRVPFDGQVKS